MKNLNYLLFAILLSASSCVSMKKYNDLEAKYQKANISENSNERELNRLKTTNEQIEKEVQELRSENQSLRETISLERRQNANEKLSLLQENQKLKTSYEQLLENSTIENKVKIQNLQNSSPKLTQSAFDNTVIASPITNKNKTLNNPSKQNNTNTPVYTHNNTIGSPQDLQQKLSTALASFPEEDVDVSYQNEDVQLVIHDEVLFQRSGSAYILSTEGKTILNSLNDILRAYPQILSFIENETLRADGNTSRHQKTQALSQFLQQIGLRYKFTEKNNAPVAFETSGTEDNRPRTVIFLKNN